MDLYQTNGNVELMLSLKADAQKAALGGTLELTPYCNMNCNMCYICHNKPGQKLLLLEEWLEIAQQLRDSGVLFLLLTGGEPLLYPHFEEFYMELHKMGFVLQVNTNGTLINESNIGLFADYPPRQLNITMYGASEDTYSSLCHFPKGYQKLINAVRLLKNSHVPFRLTCSLTPDNVHDMEKIADFAMENQIPFSPNEYMFKPVRKDGEDSDFIRFTPKDCAEIRIRSRLLIHPEKNAKEQYNSLLRQYQNSSPLPPQHWGFRCRAGRSGFWINWHGELQACGMLPEPIYSLQTYTFAEAWKNVVKDCEKYMIHEDCRNCSKHSICNVCIAMCYAESDGDFSKRPQYLCDMCNAMLEYAENQLNEREKTNYENQ